MGRYAMCVLWIGGLAACGTNPRSAIEGAARAAEEGNTLRFEALIDVDAVAGDVISEFVDVLSDLTGESLIGDEEAQELVRRLASDVRASVRDGSLFEAMLEHDLIWQAMQVEDGAAPPRRQSPGVTIGEVLVEGDQSLVALEVSHAWGTASATLDLRLERAEGREWRVVGAECLRGYIESGGVVQAVRLALSERAALASLQFDLKNLASQQEIFYSDNYRYSTRAAELAFVSSDGVTVTILDANQYGWAAVATHVDTPGSGCALWYGYRERLPSVLATPGGIAPFAPGESVCDQ